MTTHSRREPGTRVWRTTPRPIDPGGFYGSVKEGQGGGRLESTSAETWLWRIGRSVHDRSIKE